MSDHAVMPHRKRTICPSLKKDVRWSIILTEIPGSGVIVVWVVVIPRIFCLVIQPLNTMGIAPALSVRQAGTWLGVDCGFRLERLGGDNWPGSNDSIR